MKGYPKIDNLEMNASYIGQIRYFNIWGAYKWRELNVKKNPHD